MVLLPNLNLYVPVPVDPRAGRCEALGGRWAGEFEPGFSRLLQAAGFIRHFYRIHLCKPLVTATISP